ncbi:MAG: zinc dependent phospholipase C family protein, partial [Pseudomonadota bacterium]
MDAHLHTLISAHFCRSTHHHIVMDALQRLGGPDADAWRRLLLHEHTALLKGAKAPDTTFKDFKNHVLHVGGDAEWGGARGAATEWYNTAVEALAAKKWRAGAYALGVLSHYFTDPIQPFHTGQTEAEGAVHRALEWSVFKARPELKARMDALGARAVRGGDDTNFVSDMVGAGARISHRHYDTFLDHYDLDAGTRSPEAGLDDALLDATAELLAYAVAGVAHLFERAFAEAGVAPKPVRLSFDVVLAEIGKPLRVVLSKIEDANTRRAVSAAYAEYQNTGKVIRRLSKDDATIRALHAREVREIELEALDAEAPAPVGTRHGQPLAGMSPAEDVAPQTAPAPAPEPRVEAEASEVQDAPSSRLDRPKTPTLDRVLRDLAPQHDDAMEPQEAPEETGAIEPEMDQALEAPSEIEAVTSDDSSEQAIDPATPHEDDTSTEPENREAPDPRALLETASEPAKPAPRRS